MAEKDITPTPGAPDIEQQKRESVEHVYDVNEKADLYNRAGAIDAENLEHNMGVLEAVRAYPAASWWAVVMSCTIVSRDLLPGHRHHF